MVADLAVLVDPNYPLREITHDATDYYLRKGEAPGRWAGSGAALLGLTGEVLPQELHDLFAGKDPRTGRYLTPARGSSARAAARAGDEAIDVAAAAARLGISADAVRRRLQRGTLAGEKTARGHWRIPAAAVDAHLSGAPEPSSPGPLPVPGPDGCFGINDAARLAGVSPSYLKRIAAGAPPAGTTHEDGRAVQYLVAHKDDRQRWRVAPDELKRFMDARRPARAVPAYDLVTRAPKSVSILHALGHLLPKERLAAMGLPTNVAEQVLLAHHAATADAVALLERHAAFVRGPDGRVPVKGLVVAAFDHRSSREGDPLIHTHHVIANLGEGIDGRRGALDGSALFSWARTAGHVYHARLRHELRSRLGVEFSAPHEGLADVVGVPRELIDEFSVRSHQIAAAMARVGASGARAAQVAALDTRAAKDGTHAQSPNELATRAARLRFGADELADTLGRSTDRALAPGRLGEVAARLAGPDGLTARDTRIGLRDALCGFAGALAEGATLDDLEGWARRLLSDGRRFVPVVGGPARAAGLTRQGDGRRVQPAWMTERAWSTPELLTHEAALLDAHRHGLGPDGQGVGAGVADPDAVAAALAARPTLRAEQSALVRRVTSSGVGVEVVVGGPGTGKTFALGAAAEAWRACGYRVVGASLQGGAAETLAAQAGLDERHTLASLLGRCDRRGAAYLDGAILIVDEAGMAGTRQLARLARYARAADSKLVLVGDPDQIPEVDAGGAFSALVAAAGEHLVVLEQNHRQVDPADRERLALIREGKGYEVLASAAAHGRLHTADDADGLRERLLADWHADPGVIGADKLLVAFTHAEVERLNSAARAILRAEGRLGDESITIRCAAPDRVVDERELRLGDRVRATRNDWALGIHTGRVGTVVALDRERFEVHVELDADHDGHDQEQPARTVTLGRGYLGEAELTGPWGDRRTQGPGLTHAYCSTVNAVQGRTSARAYVLVTEAGLYRQAAYVALSRARFETVLYALTIPDAGDAHHHDRDVDEPDPTDTTDIARAMTRDRAQTMASAKDPLANDIAELVTLPPAWLAAQRADLAARLGAPPPVRWSLPCTRAALAETTGLPLEDLESPRLTAALANALRTAGATPEAVANLVSAGVPSGSDSIGAVVRSAWVAARKLTSETQANRTGDARDWERLARLDSAMARQRQLRLARLEATVDGPIPGLLGPARAHPAGLRPWRRAASALLDYRDAAGLFDTDRGEPDPWTRALDAPPEEPALAAQYDAVRTIVAHSRAATLCADVARHLPGVPARPGAAVAALAERPLVELDAVLIELRRRVEEHTRREGIARAARAESERAAAALARARTNLEQLDAAGPARRWRGSWPRDSVRFEAAHRELDRAEADVAAAAERVRDAETSSLMAVPTSGELRQVMQAIAVREARLRREILTDPPQWVQRDIAARTAPDATDPAPDPARLAAAYGDAAVAAERRGDPGAALELVQDLLATPGLDVLRDPALADLLVADPAPGLADGLGL
ncbi:MAG: MobF family relaxase [Actinomycetota bacterium]